MRYKYLLCVLMEYTENKKKAGRKPGKDNKMPLTIYIEQSVVSYIGEGSIEQGKDMARDVAAQSVYDLRDKLKNQNNHV